MSAHPIESMMDADALVIVKETEAMLARSLARAIGEDFDAAGVFGRVQLVKDARDLLGAAAVNGLMIFPRSRMADLVARYVRMELQRVEEPDQDYGGVRPVWDAHEFIEPAPPIPVDPRLRASRRGAQAMPTQDRGGLAVYPDRIPKVDPEGDETSRRRHCLGNDGKAVECDPQ